MRPAYAAGIPRERCFWTSPGDSEEYSTTDYYRVRVGLDGSIGQREKVSEDSMKLFTNSDQMISRGDGTAFISFRDETDWTKRY